MKFRLEFSDIVFGVCAVLAFILSVFYPETLGLADQGDFERVMVQSGLGFSDEHTYYDFAEFFYKLKITNPFFLAGIVPSTSYIYPVFIAKLISRVLFLNYFDTRLLACVMFALYLSACFVIFKLIRIKNQILKSILAILFVFVFFDGTNLIFFNSMYGQAMMLVGAAMFIASVMLIADNRDKLKRGHIIFLFIASVLLLGSKLQCSVLLPFVFAVFLYVRKYNMEYKKLILIFLCILVWYTGGNYIYRGWGLNRDTQYNSVFYGILKDSENPEEDLKVLGLDSDLIDDSGKHAYLAGEEYKYPPRTGIANEKFYSKINNFKLIKYYITHPSRLLQGMEITANNAFNNYVELGTFEKTSGKKAGEREYRFEGYAKIRNNLPKTLYFIVPVYIIFILLGIYEYKKTKNKYALIYITVLLMGLIQFPMPYIGNGNADISKQLYLFNLSFDYGWFCVLTKAILAFDRKRGRNEQKREDSCLYEQ